MRIAHLADLHLGFRQYHRLTPAGINQREADVANAFRAAVDGVIAARPDAVIIAGDLFHSVRPTNHSIVFAFRQLQRIREELPDAPVILIAGNHDTPRSSDTGSILRLYEELGVHLAVDEPRRLRFPDQDLSVLAVPHAASFGSERVPLRPEGSEAHQVLVLHGVVDGLDVHASVEYGGAPLDRSELTREPWSYVALGHYHVQHEVAPRVWYSGSIEYTSHNPWGQLADEARLQVPGKGWLLADLGRGTFTRMPVPAVRRVVDLPWIDASGLTAAGLDRRIGEQLNGIAGGIEDAVVRQVVHRIPRHVMLEVDHAAIRSFKARALHLHVDFRRAEPERSFLAVVGKRQTLPELVEEFLSRRPLPERVSRKGFVSLGLRALAEAEEGEPGSAA